MLDICSTALPTPKEIKTLFPLENKEFVLSSRTIAKNIFSNKDERFALIVGPCSIHDERQGFEYGQELKKISSRSFYPIMRVYCEKPRTTHGWKGLIYDPNLDGSHDFVDGIIRTRILLLSLINLNIPCATEFLDPLIAPYIDDLITWGFIGARTTASQPHRLLCSGFSFPIGFKNAVDGNVELAIQGAYVAKSPHVFPGIDQNGLIAKHHSKGNPYSHIVLRGANNFSNHDETSVNKIAKALEKYKLENRLIIDCAHGNSQKCHIQQKQVFKEVFSQTLNSNTPIMGIMLESFLKPGSQPLSEDLEYGVSVTDPCISLEETQKLIEWAEALIEEKCLAL